MQYLDRTARRRDLRRVVGREVRADFLPVVALVERPEEHLRARVDDPAVERRQGERRRPVEAERRLARLTRGHDRLARVGPLVDAVVAAPLVGVVEPAAVGRIDAVVHAVAVADRHPVLGSDATRRTIDRPAPGIVVLHAAVDVVRAVVVHVDRVELTAGNVREVVAGLARVVRDLHAAVTSENPPVRVLGIDPHRPIVAEALRKQVADVPGEPGPRLAAVLGTQQRIAVDEDPLVVVRVHADLVERIAGLRADVVGGGVHLVPGPPAVLGAVDLTADVARPRLDVSAAVLLGFLLGRRAGAEVLRDGIQDGRGLLVEVEADAALRCWQPAPERGPRPASVGGLVNAGAGPAFGQRPRPALHVVGRGVERVGVMPVEDEVDRAGRVVDVEDLLPGLAAIDRLEHPALFVRRPEVAHRRDVDDLGIGRMDQDAGHVVRVLQAHLLPGLPGVRGLVDAVTRVGDPHARRVARAHPHDVLVRGRDGDATDAHHVLAVEDRLEGGAVVGGLPDAAVANGDVERVEVRLLRLIRHGDVRHEGAGPVRSQCAVRETRQLRLG